MGSETRCGGLLALSIDGHVDRQEQCCVARVCSAIDEASSKLPMDDVELEPELASDLCDGL